NTSMEQLNLSGNGFSGKIPATFGNLFKLTTLDLSKQNLSGDLSFELSGFSSLSGLRYVNLSSNALSGHIPATFGFLRSLVVLSLSKNHVSGFIPPELGNCSDLQVLELKNALTGPIPVDFSRLLHLSLIDLGGNNLTG
ncbi:LOW QUALITY PROTEIN: LRR_1 domain-containing protein/LRR_8 domain-containing protein, partial [Cephalotus follicularis]